MAAKGAEIKPGVDLTKVPVARLRSWVLDNSYEKVGHADAMSPWWQQVSAYVGYVSDEKNPKKPRKAVVGQPFEF